MDLETSSGGGKGGNLLISSLEIAKYMYDCLPDRFSLTFR